MAKFIVEIPDEVMKENYVSKTKMANYIQEAVKGWCGGYYPDDARIDPAKAAKVSFEIARMETTH
jgi:hypothetical protein